MKGPRMGQGHKNLSCSESVVVEMEEGFGGSNVTLPAPQKQKRKVNPSVYLPPALKPSGRKRSKVFCTYLPNSTFSQRGPSTSRILEDVVEISVENEIIQNLTDPVRIRFHHHDISVEESVSCVSWDTRKDANEIIWRKDGCRTVKISSTETECCCHHLTYFAILVQIEQRSTVRHLQALTFITAVCCAVSLFSCSILLLSLCRQRNGKDKSLSVHYGLVLALFMLNLFFILTGVLASAGSEGVCRATGALLHYALLCTTCWMAIEVFHAFWLVYMVFSTSPNPKIFYFVGFGIPALIVSILGFSLDIYGQRKIVPNEDINNPYQMCWLKYSDAGLLTHYIANVAPLIGLMCCGFIMLCLVVRKVKDRDEWRKNRTAFLSIWGLCCLFGITWSLIFLDFGPLSDTILFLFCIINALQGFFLMLRYYVLERIRKRTSELEQSSTGSTRQHMLQTQEKS
ncbi:adhesion G-protein coupled receptor G1-like [Chanos chanos]|uniref:Adhesion G-protein coupled receptor G1-like n=1 Tax=Chanos chanos TaxID=29144 RepID=A0A6J2ULQ9_CHACN|nr:adhesion G-protein coupled receptor G1-like [Chanos chanos]